jgi:hypothetical protein
MASPPARVPSPHHMFWATASLTNLTLPDHWWAMPTLRDFNFWSCVAPEPRPPARYDPPANALATACGSSTATK